MMNTLKFSDVFITQNPKPQGQQKGALRLCCWIFKLMYYSASAFASLQLPILYFTHNVLINFTSVYKLGFRTNYLVFFCFKKVSGTNHVLKQLRIYF